MRARRPGLIAFLAAFLALAAQIVMGLPAAQASHSSGGIGAFHVCGAAEPGHGPAGPAHDKGSPCAACPICAASALRWVAPPEPPALPLRSVAVAPVAPVATASVPRPQAWRVAQPRGPPSLT